MTNVNSVHARKSWDAAHLFCYIFAVEANAELQSDSAKSGVLIHSLQKREASPGKSLSLSPGHNNCLIPHIF